MPAVVSRVARGAKAPWTAGKLAEVDPYQCPQLPSTVCAKRQIRLPSLGRKEAERGARIQSCLFGKWGIRHFAFLFWRRRLLWCRLPAKWILSTRSSPASRLKAAERHRVTFPQLRRAARGFFAINEHAQEASLRARRKETKGCCTDSALAPCSQLSGCSKQGKMRRAGLGVV